ncbi:MAG TPA: HIT family protein [Candidatus Paceibacterota bacterium]|nr:HIT family protein [Candidatus Paceibacterota bacterium]
MKAVINCLFCRIASKEIGAEVIYEDEGNMAFLDIHPRAPGHAMVIPKAHRETILDVPEEELGLLFAAVKKTASMLSKALKPDGFTIGINHGKASGQEVGHLHIHIIPRYLNDKGSSIHSVVDNRTGETVQETASRIRKETN